MKKFFENIFPPFFQVSEGAKTVELKYILRVSRIFFFVFFRCFEITIKVHCSKHYKIDATKIIPPNAAHAFLFQNDFFLFYSLLYFLNKQTCTIKEEIGEK